MENQLQILEEVLGKILDYLSIDPDVELVENEDSIDVLIDGGNLSFLIGHRGDVLFGLENYLNLVVFQKTGEWTRINVDINGYKKKQRERIEEITKRSIDKVRFFDESVELAPMNPADRRIVHMFVAEYDDVVSESTGEKGDRHVVIKKKN